MLFITVNFVIVFSVCCVLISLFNGVVGQQKITGLNIDDSNIEDYTHTFKAHHSYSNLLMCLPAGKHTLELIVEGACDLLNNVLKTT